LTADGNIGVGISGKASVISLSIGAELGNLLKISGQFCWGWCVG